MSYLEGFHHRYKNVQRQHKQQLAFHSLRQPLCRQSLGLKLVISASQARIRLLSAEELQDSQSIQPKYRIAFGFVTCQQTQSKRNYDSIGQIVDFNFSCSNRHVLYVTVQFPPRIAVNCLFHAHIQCKLHITPTAFICLQLYSSVSNFKFNLKHVILVAISSSTRLEAYRLTLNHQVYLVHTSFWTCSTMISRNHRWKRNVIFH